MAVLSESLPELERVNRAMQRPESIFVFGSNLAGRHGAGAAKTAYEQYKYPWGYAIGLYGRAYGIPTKGLTLKPLPRQRIAEYVQVFLKDARKQQQHRFIVTRVGCGFAGFTDDQIAPLFFGAPANVSLPPAWDVIISRHLRDRTTQA